MLKPRTIAALFAIPMAVLCLAGTLERQIITSSQFSREINVLETASEWRDKLGVTTNGVVGGGIGTDTNAIPNLNGKGTNTMLYNPTLNNWVDPNAIANLNGMGTNTSLFDPKIYGLNLSGGTYPFEVYQTSTNPAPSFFIDNTGKATGDGGGLTNLNVTVSGWTLNLWGLGWGTNAGNQISLTNGWVAAKQNTGTVIDLSYESGWIQLAGNLTLTGVSNLPIGGSGVQVSRVVCGGGSDYTFSVPASWRGYGSYSTNGMTVAAGKRAQLAVSVDYIDGTNAISWGIIPQN